MANLRRLAPYALAALGLAVLVTVGWLVPELAWPVRLAGLAFGGVATIVGAFWIDHRQDPIESAHELAIRVLSLVALGLLFVAISNFGLSGRWRLIAGLLGVGLMAVVGYRAYVRRVVTQFDERERRQRYYAGYNGFLAMGVLLFAIGVAALALAPPGEEAISTGTTAVSLGAFAVLIAGVLVALVSEGWYRTRA